MHPTEIKINELNSETRTDEYGENGIVFQFLSIPHKHTQKEIIEALKWKYNNNDVTMGEVQTSFSKVKHLADDLWFVTYYFSANV
ncbi:MAG: hypothetical protein GY861_03005 [bacterium]|nr:hypothetical protein [bacterium]